MTRGRIVAPVFCALFLAGCREPIANTLRVGFEPIVENLPIYVAIEKGFFRNEGLEVQPASMSWMPPLEALYLRNANRIDVGSSNVVSILIARERGLDVVALAGGAVESREQSARALLVRPDSPIRSAADLRGKIIAINALGSMEHLMLKQYLASIGLDESCCKFLEVPFPKMAAVMAGGQVDAAASKEPHVTDAIIDGRGKVIDHYVEAGPPAVLFSYVSTGALASERPEALRQFARAIAKSNQFIRDHESAARKILNRWSAIRKETLPRMTLVRFQNEHRPDDLVPWLRALSADGMVGKSMVLDSTFPTLSAAVLPSGDARDQTVTAPEWTVQKRVEINATKEALVAFGRISIGPAGRMAVAQSQDRRVIIFDSLGRRERVIGARGEGPGEVQALGPSGWMADSIWLADNSSRRVSIFSSSGRYIRQLNAPGRVASSIGGQEWSLTGGGPLVVFPGERGVLAMFITQLTPGKPSCPCIAAVIDSAKLVSTPLIVPESPDESIQLSGGGSIGTPFRWDAFFDASPDGQAIAMAYPSKANKAAGEYHVAKLALNGDTLFSRDYSFERVAIPTATVQALIERAARSVPDIPRAEMQRRASSHYPPVRRVVLANDGRTWLLLFTTAPALMSQERWLVLDQRGAPIARVSLPLGFHLVEAERDNIWGYHEDADGLQHPSRFSIVTRPTR